jgi:hypothetical protein
MSNKNNAELQAGRLVINNQIVKIIDTHNTGAGKVAMGVNGEVVLMDYNIIGYGALDMDLVSTLTRKANYLHMLSFLKEQGYRLVSNITMEVK